MKKKAVLGYFLCLFSSLPLWMQAQTYENKDQLPAYHQMMPVLPFSYEYNPRINSVNMGLFWKSSPKVSMEWNTFLFKQNGYSFNSVRLSPGLKMNINYCLTNKLKLSLWGQYLLNRSTDPFTRAGNNQPQNGVGLRLEYSPTPNSTYILDVSKQQNRIDTQDFFIQVEGKAAFKF